MDQTTDTKLSVADDSLDTLVEAASVPNLAALFQSAKDKGLINTAVAFEYAHGAVKP